MSVYVDYPFVLRSKDLQALRVGGRHGHLWCHMWADTTAELHAMAAKIGMRPAWFQNKSGFPHYDLVPTRRAHALRLGAIEKDLRELLQERKSINAPLALP